MNPWVRFSRSLHRRLVRAFPHEFQVLHGNDLEQMGDDAIPFVWREYGFFGLVRLLAAAAIGLVAEYLTEMGRDVRYAVRRLAASPGFTALGVLSLALCIGMSSLFLLQVSAFSTPAPGVRDPAKLISPQTLVAYPYFEEYSKQHELFSASAAFIGPTPFTVGDATIGTERERITGHLVSFDYFDTLGVTPASGRFFDAATDRSGSAPTVVVTDNFWRTHMNGDANAVGSTLHVNGQDATVVGIAPAGFRGAFPAPAADIFVPLTANVALAPELRGGVLHDLNAPRFRALLRLADGVPEQKAAAMIQVLTQNLDLQKPEAERPKEARTITLMDGGASRPFPRQAVRTQQIFALVLFCTVLGIACANLAVLLLARGSERRKEVAIRLSVGASRFRLVRQQLTESVTLAMAGGVGGLIFLRWVLHISKSLQPPESLQGFESPYSSGLAMAVIILGVSVLAGFLFGLTPALASVRGEFVTALKQGTESRLRAYSRFGIRNQLMLFQIASSLMLMLLTGFIVLGYQRTNDVDPGFDASNLYLFNLDPVRDSYTPEQTSDLLDRLQQRLESVPEVTDVAFSLDLPFSQLIVIPSTAITVVDGKGQQGVHNVVRQRVGSGYFKLLGVPLLQGREFAVEDQGVGSADQATPIVVNETAVRRLFEGADPLGQTVREGDRVYSVVGVVKDLKSGLLMGAAPPTLFAPMTADDVAKAESGGATVLLRGRPGSPALEAATAEIAVIDPKLTVFNSRTFLRDTEQFNQMIEWSTILNGGIGVFGILLSIIALFSVTVHAVARRRKEIGVRVALGAQRNQVMRLVLREGVALVSIGGILGFGGAYAMTRIFSSFTSRLAELFAVGTDDPLFTIAAPLVWAALALLACYPPARRAMRINPAATLKAE